MRRPTGPIKSESTVRVIVGPLLTVLAWAAVVGAASVTGGCKRQVPRPKPKPVNVSVETVEPISKFVDTFILPGVVEPNRVVKVCAEVAARVESIDSEEGAACKEGKELIHLNTELLKAEHDRTKAQLEFDRGDFKRVQGLRKRNLATAMELEQANTRRLSSKANFDSADARLRRAVIRAPIDGVVNRLNKEDGEYVHVGECVAEIVDIDTAKVVVDVPERDIGFLEKNRVESIFVGPNDSRRVVGEIKYISELAHPEALTTRVELEVDNVPGTGPGGKRALRSGQIVRVRLTRQILKDVIMVPLAAVIPLEKGHAVYVVQSNRAIRRDVKLGLIKGSRVRVVSGLRAGEKLIVSGQQYVGPGQQVVVSDPAAPTKASTQRTADGEAEVR